MITRVDLEQIACALEFEGRPSAADQVRDTATQLEAMQAALRLIVEKASGAGYCPEQAVSEMEAIARASLSDQGKG